MPPSQPDGITGPNASDGVTSLPTGKQNAADDTPELMEMHLALPDSTDAERRRFLSDRNGDTRAAISKLRSYLEWRKGHCNHELADLDPWSYATRLAIESTASKEGGKNSNKRADGSIKLPCTVFMLEHEQSAASATIPGNQKRYLQHFPARIDPRLATTTVYALAIAIYLDHVLDRDSTEKVTLIIDVRSGHGWANIKAINLLPFIQSTVRLLCDLHPARLERCIVFPVPKVADVIWKAVKPFLEKATAGRVLLVSGPAGRNDKVPKKMSEHLDEELILKLESRRTSCFCVKS